MAKHDSTTSRRPFRVLAPGPTNKPQFPGTLGKQCDKKLHPATRASHAPTAASDAKPSQPHAPLEVSQPRPRTSATAIREPCSSPTSRPNRHPLAAANMPTKQSHGQPIPQLSPPFLIFHVLMFRSINRATSLSTITYAISI